MIRIGVDIGGTGIQSGIVDENGKITHKTSIKTSINIPFEEQISNLAESIRQLTLSAGYTEADISSIGFGIPGIADQKTGDVIKCTNMNWVNVPLRAEFQKHINVPIYIDNDATVAGLAESAAGVSKGTSSSVFITIGTGIGAGIVINGKVWSGAHGIGSELGHVILKLDGEPCTCGNRGCLERYCSATAIIRMAREACTENPDSLMLKKAETLDGINAKIVFDSAKEEDPTAVKVFNYYISCLAQAIASIINLIDPEVIVLGGGVSKAGDFLLNALKKEVPQYVLFNTLPMPEIKIAQLGSDAGIVGAASLG